MTALNSIQKVSRSGNSLMINIPKKIADILGIKLGDYIKVEFGDIVKKSKKKDLIKEEERINNELLKLKDDELPEL